VFTDGSLLDGQFPSEYQSLGWAFLIMGTDGEQIASAFGSTPRWITTIQGAEMWAVRMALSHASFPERVLTDCDAVRTGVLKPLSWAQSSKRRYSRLWVALFTQLEECEPGVVQWMPAHTPESSIGFRETSAGDCITDHMWCANQIVDLLAKDGAESMRYSVRDREWFTGWEKQLKELAIFLGRLTCIANAYPCTDGSKLRDSEAIRSKRGPKLLGTIGRSKPKGSFAKPSSSVSAATHKVRGKRVSKGGRWGKDPPWCTISSSSTSKKGQVAKAHTALEANLDVSFLDAWREGRARCLRPSCGPSADSRMDALRQRIAAKVAASSS